MPSLLAAKLMLIQPGKVISLAGHITHHVAIGVFLGGSLIDYMMLTRRRLSYPSRNIGLVLHESRT